MLLDEIGSIVREHEEEVLFDVEAPEHWYEVEFKNNKITLYEIDEYHFNGDEWGEIELSWKKQTNLEAVAIYLGYETDDRIETVTGCKNIIHENITAWGNQ